MHIKSFGIFFLLLSLIFIRVEICEARYFDTEILKDIYGVKVNCIISEDLAAILKLNLKEFRDSIESELNKSAVNIYKGDTTEFFKSGRPELQINIQPKNIQSQDLIDFLIETSFVITVRSFTNTKATNRVPIIYWSDFKCGGSIDDINSIIKMHINSFVEAVCSPQKGFICKNR